MFGGPRMRIPIGRGSASPPVCRVPRRSHLAVAWLVTACLIALWISVGASPFEMRGISATLLRQQPAPPAIPAAGLSFAVYATGTTCGAISMGGGAFVDSFDSSLGTYADTRTQGQARVGATGNINLSGSKTIVYGRIFALNTNVGSCKNGVPGVTLSGGAQVTEGYVRLLSPPVLPTPAAVSPGSQDYNVSSNLALPPGSYGRIAVSGGATLTLSAGTYTINSLALSGGSVLATPPSGQVIVNLAGVKVPQPVNMSGGTLQNLSGIPLNFQLIYGGSQSIVLSGGTMAYGVIYAPEAGVKLSGGGEWFGAMTVKTLDNSGGTPLHYDRALIAPPTITSTVTPAANANGWHGANVTVSFTCSSPLGVANCPSPVTVTTEGRSQVVSRTVTDVAGNTATASVTLNIDKTPPVVTAAASPAANGNGWNSTPVVVSFAATDGLSGVNPTSVTAPVTVSADGTNLSATGQAADLAGNIGTATRTGINIDRVVPTITAALSPAANAGGWNKTPVTAHFTCADSGSGIASCGPDTQLSSEAANQTASGTATDLAGNTASATSAAVNIDLTPPVVTITSPPNGSGVSSSPATLTGTVSDALSGVSGVACNGQAGTVSGGTFQCAVTLARGNNSISVVATDVAGHTQTASWSLTFTPTDEKPVLTLTIAEPAHGGIVAQSPVTVRGTVNDPTARVTVQNVIASVVGTMFEARNITLSEGRNDVAVRATTIAGQQASATLTLTLDSIAPALTVFSPPDRSLFTATSATVSAAASDATPMTCAINGMRAEIQNGQFSNVLGLTSGSNTVAVSCTDAAGHTSTRALTLFQDTAPLVISAVEPADGATGVPTSAPVRITFSEPVNSDTTTPATVILRAGTAILPADVIVSPDGLVATATPRVPLPQGTNIVTTVTAGVRDKTGNPLAVPFLATFATEGTALAPGVVVGEVYDDSRSRPLPGAIVEALDRKTRQVLTTTETDERGKYLLDPGRPDFLVRVGSVGYTSVERTSVESRGNYAEALDARLTPTAASQVVQAALGGTVTTAAGDTVMLPAGTFDSDASVSLTAISSQGPIATFPAGWTPLSIVNLEGPQGLPFSATLRLKDRSQAAAGRSAVVAYYDRATASWVALAQVVVPAAGTPVEYTEFIRPGQFALLVTDEGSGGPAAAVVGEPLPASTAGEIPSGAQAQGTVTPSAGRSDDPTPAQARVEITGTTTLRSGTLLRGDFMEVVTLRSGGVVSPFDTSQDFVAYRTLADTSGNSLAASFPIAPSRTFPPADVADGSVTVRLSRGVTTGRTLVGPAGGGVSSGDGSRVVVPAGALSSNVPVSLRRLDSATFPLAVPTSVTFVGGLDLDLSGAVASLPLTLSLSGSGSTVPTGSTVVIAEVRSVKGIDRLVIAALGQVNASDVITTQAIAGEALPGVRQSGRYGFYRLDGTVAPVRGTARTDTGQRAGHVTELAALPFVSVTDAAGTFVLVSQPGSFDLTATAAANGDRARVSGTTGTPLAEIVIGPTPPRVDAITVRLPPLDGDFAGPIALVGRPAPGVDDDSSGQSAGNANGIIEAGERIELTLHVRNDGTIPIQGGFFALDLRGPPGTIPVEPARVPLAFLAPDEPQAVGPFVFTVPAGTNPALLRYRLAYANNGGLANVIPFSVPLGVEHHNVPPASEITIRFSEPVIRTSLHGAVTLSREDASGLVPVDASLVVASDDASLVLRPLAPLTDDAVYRITLTSQIVDTDKCPLADAPYVERLRTADRTPPPIIAPGQIEASFPGEEGFVTITGSPGSVNPGDVVIGLNATTGFSALAAVNADGSFSVSVAADVTDELSVLVRDASGNTTTIRVGTLVRRDPTTGDVVLTIVGRAGGTVSTPDGIRLIVPEGAVQRGTELAVKRLIEPFQLPADLASDTALAAAFNARFTVVDRVRITTNVTRFTAPVTLSLPAPPGAAVGQQFVVWRSRTVTFGGPLADLDRQTGIPLADNPRVTAERLVIAESATVKQQGGQLVLSTDSPPFPGITEGGDYTIAQVDPSLVYFAGEVRRDSVTGPVVPGVVVRSLPDAAVNSAFAAVTDSAGRFLMADGSLTGPFGPSAVVSSRLDFFDPQFTRVIRRDVRGTVGPPAPPVTVVAHLEDLLVLPTRVPPEIIDILGDLERPVVGLSIKGPSYGDGLSRLGDLLAISVQSEDNDIVVFVGLEVDEGNGLRSIPLNPDGTATFAATTDSLLTFRATVRDRQGLVAVRDARVRVVSAPAGSPLAPGPLAGAPAIVHSSTVVGIDQNITIRMSEPVVVETFLLRDRFGVNADATVETDSSNTVVTIRPARNLHLNGFYTVDIRARDLAGQLLDTTFDVRTEETTLLTIPLRDDVEDVAVTGDLIVAVTHPRGSNVGDVGKLHIYRYGPTVDDPQLIVERVAEAPTLGRPYSITSHRTSVLIANRFLGYSATKSPFVAPFVPGETDIAPETVVSCTLFPITPTFIGLATAPEVCQGFSLLWDYLPQPASNVQVLDLSDPHQPRHVTGSPLNSIYPGLWDPNAWPNRAEVIDGRVAVHNFLGNIEFFSIGTELHSQGVVGQVRRFGEIGLRGADGQPNTTDDRDHEFLDAVPFGDLAVTLVRDGVRVMSTQVSGGENANQLAFWPMLGASAGRIGGVIGFEWGGDEGTDTTADLAFVATADEVLRIIDLRPPVDPHSPQVLAVLPGTFGSMSFDACRGLAYLHGRNDKFHVIDFNDPSRPVELNTDRGGLVPLFMSSPGPAVGFNGNASKDLAVFLTTGTDVAFIQVSTPGRVKFPKRRACRQPPSVAFINNQNVALDPMVEALNVSNFVSLEAPDGSDDLPPLATFGITSGDPDNFRLEVVDEVAARAGDQNVSATLQIGRSGPLDMGCRFQGAQDVTYMLEKGTTHPLYRSKTIRLVAGAKEGECENHPAEDQTILVALGDTITLSYTSARSGEAVNQEFRVGRPSTEEYNGPNQRRHDIRNVKLRVVVFSRPDGSGPSLTLDEVTKEVKRANERLAQSTIHVEAVSVEMGNNRRGVALPQAFLDGFSSPVNPGLRSGRVVDDRPPNADELEIVALVDQDPTSIDVFYVPFLITGTVSGQPSSVPASAYPEARFGGGSAIKNLVVISSPSDAPRGDDPYILPHELMHILLNDWSHRTADPTEALFSRTGDGKLRTRIGPFSRDKLGTGDSDTATIRRNAERLR